MVYSPWECGQFFARYAHLLTIISPPTLKIVSTPLVKVKFDHMSDPYDVERVQSRFMVMKNFYVYREQFPLILAYAVTIHKCQGLSLDCAIQGRITGI